MTLVDQVKVRNRVKLVGQVRVSLTGRPMTYESVRKSKELDIHVNMRQTMEYVAKMMK